MNLERRKARNLIEGDEFYLDPQGENGQFVMIESIGDTVWYTLVGEPENRNQISKSTDVYVDVS